MKRRQTYVEIPDDGLVPIPHQIWKDGKLIWRGSILVTPEKARTRAQAIMAGFDDLPPAERYAWNYAKTTRAFNPSSSSLRYNRRNAKAIKSAGATALLEELGL